MDFQAVRLGRTVWKTVQQTWGSGSAPVNLCAYHNPVSALETEFMRPKNPVTKSETVFPWGQFAR
jgi:hypothetical protein